MNKKIILYVFLSVAVISSVAVSLFGFNISGNATLNNLLKDVLSRLFLSVFLILISVFFYPANLKRYLKPPSVPNVLWIIPCAVTVIVNFPFSAIVSGKAIVNSVSLIPLFLADCLLIGITEELLFRLIVHTKIKEFFSGIKNGYVYAVLISSSVFALFHLTNLLYGAGIGATLFQVGYTFLTGAMFAVTFDKTGNVLFCIILHAVFDVGGNIIPVLGSGVFQDEIFWIITVVFGIITFLHVASYCFKINKQHGKICEK